MSDQTRSEVRWEDTGEERHPPQRPVDPTIDLTGDAPTRMKRADYHAAQETERKHRANWLEGRRSLTITAGVILAGAVGAIAVLSSGGGDDGELRPADDVREEIADDTAHLGTIGEPTQLGDGLTATVESIEREVDGDGDATDRFAVTLRVENTSDSELANPNVMIRCSNAEDAGSWYADSTFDMYGSLPPNTFSEGAVLLGLPDPDTGAPIDCADPVVSIDPILFFGEARRIDYPVS